tara:strand:- start:129 stop:341 length:213 start_codon:yes stop_codon:yes gene_type:complete
VGWDNLSKDSLENSQIFEQNKKVDNLQKEVEDLRKLVNTLLTVIAEEADGISSGSAPMHASTQAKRGYCM